jgi:hypothetical protein
MSIKGRVTKLEATHAMQADELWAIVLRSLSDAELIRVKGLLNKTTRSADEDAELERMLAPAIQRA